ncbi:MAG TPA: class I SAM-dependent rRNA methyltransferase, partial [Candidatus Ozemobacteraceae bacterium]
DSAKPALAEAVDNLKLNGFDPSKNPVVTADMYDYLQDSRNGPFDLLIVDPPSMARNRADLERASRAYVKLNTLAFNRVAPGGLLFTASCTSQFSREAFVEAVTEASRKAGRRARIIRESFHAADHPISLAHPEGRYLKGLLLEVS